MTRPLLAALITFLGVFFSSTCRADEVVPRLTVGTQEIGLLAGYLLPHRLTDKSTTKQSGPAFMPSWAMVLTDPAGPRWLRGQLMFGAEIVYIQFQEPVLTHGVGFAPKIKWLFEGTGRLRPYVEFAGGPFYTDLAGQIPEESSRFNFVLSAGGGLSWYVTSQLALNVGYRFLHISNAGTRYPNLGLNSSLPFGGFSFNF
ncbi:MAG TPA: acyloxyacyl hydrolase [Nitrospira sp.]|jgi:lipid A 3-O-deacylase|nr:acyloxyacyl hydrolase [Nitrospira sp.]